MPSRLEQRVNAALLAVCEMIRVTVAFRGAGPRVGLLINTHVLDPEEGHGSADFVLVEWGLVVMADGEQHFPSKPHKSQRRPIKGMPPRRPQVEVDDAFNRAALGRKLSVLRVHFAEDQSVIEDHVARAVRDSRDPSVLPFVRFTPKFGREDEGPAL